MTAKDVLEPNKVLDQVLILAAKTPVESEILKRIHEAIRPHLDGPLKQLGARIMEQGDRKGWNSKFTPASALLNIHSEVTETWEHIRAKRGMNEVFFDESGKPDGVPVELIDILYRTLHMLAYYDLNADELLERKFEFNEGRSWENKAS